MKTSERFMIATCCLLWVVAGLFAQTKDSVAVRRDSVLPLTKMEVVATDSLAVADSVSPVQGAGFGSGKGNQSGIWSIPIRYRLTRRCARMCRF